MTDFIAILALCASVLLLIVHYRNQLERRHGEIAKLRSDFMQKLSNAHHRMLSVQMHLETIRLELRHIPGGDDKYDAIEKQPRLISCANDVAHAIAQFQNELEELDTVKANRGNVLMRFQSAEHGFYAIEEKVSDLEQTTLKLLKSISSNQE